MIGEKPQVVVVDDEQPILDVVCEVLDDARMTAVGCGHGHQALACIREMKPQLVILDVQMPGVDGVQVFRMMRADPQTTAIPVIFFTANAGRLKEWLPDYEQMGASLLPKPFDLDKLLRMVRRSLAA